MENVLAILLAGGAGERLYPLTRDTAKPAVPFGGAYRIIDFTLSNCINSDVRRIFILTQYKSLELIRHMRDGWNILSAELGEYIEVLPPMKRVHEDWYQGTADAVFQNFQSIEAEAPEHTLILSGDHIYKMNYREMLDWHRQHNADITIATIQVRAGRGRPLRRGGDRRGLPHRGLRGEAASTATRRARASIPSWSAPPWGFTCSRPTCCCERCTRTRRTPTPATISART